MDRIAPVEEHGVRYTRQVISWSRHGDAGILGVDTESPRGRRIARDARADHHSSHGNTPLPGDDALSAKNDLDPAIGDAT